jgi:hypothetical protein
LDTQIEGGQQVAMLSGDLGGSGDQPAEMVVTASFLSVTGAALGSLSIGPVGAADRNDQTEMLARTGAALIPREMRAIDVTMSATGGAGNDQYNTAFADNLSLSRSPKRGDHCPGEHPQGAGDNQQAVTGPPGDTPPTHFVPQPETAARAMAAPRTWERLSWAALSTFVRCQAHARRLG